jgi:hypothetical protein
MTWRDRISHERCASRSAFFRRMYVQSILYLESLAWVILHTPETLTWRAALII